MGKLILVDHRETGDIQIATHAQDCSSILAFNQEQRKHSDENWKADEDIKACARIPLATWLHLKQIGIADDANELMRFLENNPQFKRTEKRLI